MGGRCKVRIRAAFKFIICKCLQNKEFIIQKTEIYVKPENINQMLN